jgi:hypothetical protein
VGATALQTTTFKPSRLQELRIKTMEQVLLNRPAINAALCTLNTASDLPRAAKTNDGVEMLTELVAKHQPSAKQFRAMLDSHTDLSPGAVEAVLGEVAARRADNKQPAEVLAERQIEGLSCTIGITGQSSVGSLQQPFCLLDFSMRGTSDASITRERVEVPLDQLAELETKLKAIIAAVERA